MTAASGPRQGPGRPAGVDSLDTRQRVIDAACKCFAQYGYGPATNTVIADEAGVTAGSVYYHFGAKRNLFNAVCENVFGKLVDHIADSVGGVYSLPALLEVTLTAFMELNRKSPECTQFVAGAPIDVRRHAELADGPIAEQGRRMSNVLSAAVERGQEAGLIPADVDPVAAARVVRSVGTGFVDAATRFSPDEMDAARELFVKLVLRAMR